MARRLLALGWWLAFVARPACAQAPATDPVAALVGRPVTTVKILVEGAEADSPALNALVDIRSGTPLSLEAVSTVVRRLAGGATFDDVQVLATAAAADVMALRSAGVTASDGVSSTTF